jgi:hypothetical protein
MVEPDLVGLSAEQDSWAEFVFLEICCIQDARVVETLENPKFLKGSSSDRLTRSGIRAGHGIQPYAAKGVGCGVFGVEILESEQSILFD